VTIAVAILAAGASSRFGGCKLLASYNNCSLIETCIEQAALIKPDAIFVITGCWHQALLDAIPEHRQKFVLNDAWAEGMSTSLKLACMSCQPFDKMLVLLPDQALLRKKHFSHLIGVSELHPQSIICATYDSRRGVPALFPSQYYQKLMKLSGDQGARALLNEKESCCSVPMPEAEFDIDTQEDLEGLKQLLEQG
jgi:molybdenum cofactor cytidylyltransferase